MLFAALAVGCSKKSTADATMAPESPGDDLTALERQLAQRESQLEAVGVTPSAKKIAAGPSRDVSTSAGAGGDAWPAPTSAPTRAEEDERKPNDGGGRCEQVCEISTAICALEDQICGLLPRHRGDARYQAACDRSVADCQLATEACHACTAN